MQRGCASDGAYKLRGAAEGGCFGAPSSHGLPVHRHLLTGRTVSHSVEGMHACLEDGNADALPVGEEDDTLDA